MALKGLSYLLEAMAKLRTERDVTLTIIGKPRDGASNDLIDQLGTAEIVPVDLQASAAALKHIDDTYEDKVQIICCTARPEFRKAAAQTKICGPTAPEPGGRLTGSSYQVGKGDTLTKIARSLHANVPVIERGGSVVGADISAPGTGAAMTSATAAPPSKPECKNHARSRLPRSDCDRAPAIAGKRFPSQAICLAYTS